MGVLTLITKFYSSLKIHNIVAKQNHESIIAMVESGEFNTADEKDIIIKRAIEYLDGYHKSTAGLVEKFLLYFYDVKVPE